MMRIPRFDFVRQEGAEGGTDGLLARWVARLRRSMHLGSEPASLGYRHMARLIDREFDRAAGGVCLAFASPDSDDAGAAALLMLAYCLQGELHSRVLLVDSRLKDKSGGITARLSLGEAAGFAEVVSEGFAGREDLVRATAVPGVDVLPAGDPAGRATPLKREHLHGFLAAACARYDHVLVQVSSPLRDTRAVATALEARAVFLLAEEKHTFVKRLDECRRVLDGNGARDVRVVVTGAGA